MKVRVGVAVAAVLGGVLSVSAAQNLTWLGLTGNWSDPNWAFEEQTIGWVDGNNAVFGADGAATSVTVDKDVMAAQVSVAGEYSFGGSGLLNVQGPFAVGAGAVARVSGPIGTAGVANFKKTGEGELVINGTTGTNDFYRLDVMDGTLRINGGKHYLAANANSAGADAMPFHANGGKLIIEGGAELVQTNGTSYAANSGTEILVTNGVMNLWKVSEFLNGFGDTRGSSKNPVASVTVKDNGTFIANGYRVGKVVKGSRPSPQYGLTTVGKGGTLVVNTFRMDATSGRNDYCGGMDFDGGLLVITNTAEGSWFTPIPDGGNWTNVTLRILEGGLRVRLAGAGQYPTFQHGFASGAEQDGGMTVEGNGFLYLNGASSYNGGLHLRGATVIPSNDRAFGAVPETPMPNIFFDTSSPMLHLGSSWTIHQNRTVLIGTNVAANIGVAGGNVGYISGRILGSGEEGALSRLYIRSNWPGCLAIGPADGATNQFGRLRVDGHLRHVAGTTLITSNAFQKTGDDSHFVIDGGGSYSDTRGAFDIAGGLVKVVRGSWLQLANCGQLIVTNGTFDANATSELLVGLGSPGRVIVGGNGVLTCNRLRLTQDGDTKATDPKSQVLLKKGGTLKAHTFWIDPGANGSATFLLDGGTLCPRSSQVNFLGEDDLGNKWHKRIFVRAGEGGGVVDTAGYNCTIKNPILSGAENDGGFTKKGEGVLTLNSTNSYNGATRVDGGTLKFAHANGFPGGDLAVSAKALKDSARKAELIHAVNLAFRAGAKIRVVDTEGVEPTEFGRRVVLAKTDNPMGPLPELVTLDAEGKEITAGAWSIAISEDRKTLTFGAQKGMLIYLR